MKTIFLVLLFMSSVFAAEPEAAPDPQLKVDLMFCLPEEHPFSFDVLYGSPEAAANLKSPEHIEVYRIDPDVPSGEPGTKTILGHAALNGPMVPSPSSRATLVDLFTAKDTFCDQLLPRGHQTVFTLRLRP